MLWLTHAETPRATSVRHTVVRRNLDYLVTASLAACTNGNGALRRHLLSRSSAPAASPYSENLLERPYRETDNADCKAENAQRELDRRLRGQPRHGPPDRQRRMVVKKFAAAL